MKKLFLIGILGAVMSFAATYACVSKKVVIPNYSQTPANGDYVMVFDQEGKGSAVVVYQKDKTFNRAGLTIFANYVGTKQVGGQDVDVFKTSDGVYYYVQTSRNQSEAFITIEVNHIDANGGYIPAWIVYYCADVNKIQK